MPVPNVNAYRRIYQYLVDITNLHSYMVTGMKHGAHFGALRWKLFLCKLAAIQDDGVMTKAEEKQLAKISAASAAFAKELEKAMK